MPKTPGLKMTFRQYRGVVREQSKPLSDAEKYRQGDNGNRSQSSENAVQQVLTELRSGKKISAEDVRARVGTALTDDESVEVVAILVRNHEPLQQLCRDAQRTKVYPLY